MHLPHTTYCQIITGNWHGGVIGLERELRSKISRLSYNDTHLPWRHIIYDFIPVHRVRVLTPDRIASNNSCGYWLPGGWVIFRSEERISGITTAAIHMADQQPLVWA